MSKSTTSLIPQGNIALDAATANMGSPWKMPTYKQTQDLINGTNHTYTTINGVNGVKLTNKTNSSQYIFLPAAGYWSYTSFFDSGSYGHYWTTLPASTGYAHDFRFNQSNEITSSSAYYHPITCGCSVRAIKTFIYK